MKNIPGLTTVALLLLLVTLMLPGCRVAHAGDTDAGAPPPPKVTPLVDLTLFSVEHPEQFPLITAEENPSTSELIVTGTITPDVTRNVPVVSLASGRVSDLQAKLGDTVRKGQILMTVRSDDVSGGYSNYRMAAADETLARTQFQRARDLYEHGAIALNDLQVAEDTEEKARVTLDTLAEHLRLLGNDPNKVSTTVEISSPVSGVITDQQVTNSSLVQAYSTPYPFTISDISSVWVVCDVYENDLASVKIGDSADVTLNAYPGRTFRGKVSNIGTILDPNLRTAKVRIEVQNPGFMRMGMFVKATFHGQVKEMHTIVPASAVLRMHDRDFVFVPAGAKFRRVEVTGGDVLDSDPTRQEVKAGLKPGDQVVSNALVLDHVLGQ